MTQGSAADLYAVLRETQSGALCRTRRFRRLPDRQFLAGAIGAHPRWRNRNAPDRRARIHALLLPEEDAQLREALISSPKERAEHIMLVDLERNDLGRICQPGSVQVDELMAVRSYAHVHHIESSVHGRLRAGTTPGQVLRALFPGGTITGCPKVRTMQIIAELEASPRQRLHRQHGLSESRWQHGSEYSDPHLHAASEAL